MTEYNNNDTTSRGWTDEAWGDPDRTQSALVSAQYLCFIGRPRAKATLPRKQLPHITLLCDHAYCTAVIVTQALTYFVQRNTKYSAGRL